MYSKFIAILLVVICSYSAGADNTATIESIIQNLEQKYSVDVIYQHVPNATWNTVNFEECSQSDYYMLAGYMEMLTEEFNKYPVSLVKKSGVKQIAVVKSLSISGQFRSALPDYVKEILYLDYFRGNANETYQQHVIHHEYFHLIEQQINHDVYYKDPQWKKLNTADFKYGNGGVNNQTGNMYQFSHPQAGFINRYSMTALEEDKAEISAALFVESESDLLNNWKTQDQILCKKIDYIKNFYYTLTPDMNQQFWNSYQSQTPSAPGQQPSNPPAPDTPQPNPPANSDNSSSGHHGGGFFSDIWNFFQNLFK